jgi:hypothetical protein
MYCDFEEGGPLRGRPKHKRRVSDIKGLSTANQTKKKKMMTRELVQGESAS